MKLKYLKSFLLVVFTLSKWNTEVQDKILEDFSTKWFSKDMFDVWYEECVFLPSTV